MSNSEIIAELAQNSNNYPEVIETCLERFKNLDAPRKYRIADVTADWKVEQLKDILGYLNLAANSRNYDLVTSYRLYL